MAQDSAVNLPQFTVFSPRVANQAPAGTFASPVSALRYEPLVDIQGRNLSEAQADLTLRGGIFENTGVRLGAVSLYDPQTGHYLAELPVAPAMLGAPGLLTGTAHAAASSNSTVGAIAYDWRPIRSGGAAAIGLGEARLNRQDFYQGFVAEQRISGRTVAADVAWARSESAGAMLWGEHDFDRINARVQLSTPTAQTDLFAGYQSKFFGWPNLYTPFNSNETESLQTLLFAANHRTKLAGSDFVEFGAWHRRNKDDYAFNRFAPLGAIHPFQHTTWAHGASIGGRRELGELALTARSEISADALKSTSLTAGNYNTRSVSKWVVVPEKTWDLGGSTLLTVKAGATHDDSNRAGGATSPIFEIAREQTGSALNRIYISYSGASQLPTYTALNSNAAAGLFRGNPNLSREKSRNLEWGAAGKIGPWLGQAALFFRRDDGLVDWTFRRGVTARTANAVDIDTKGLELVARRAWAHCDLTIGYTALSKDASYRGAVVDASFYALNFARHRVTAALSARLGHGFELRLDNVGRIQSANFLRVVGGDRALTTALGLIYRPPAWRGVELSLQADNLWDEKFQDVPAVPAAPRQLSFTIARVW